jgi:glutathione S-transferase
MSLVFYYAPQSTAVVTHWVLEELGVPYEKVKIDFKHKPPAFLALNPNGYVPVIVHDGTAIFESAAITIYLGETFGVDKGLYPPPGPSRGDALKWIVWGNVTLGGAIARYLHAGSERTPAERRNAKAAEAFRAEAEHALEILDGALAGKSWLTGERFGLVDAHVASFVVYATMVGFDTKKWANLEAWSARATARPGHATSMQA